GTPVSVTAGKDGNPFTVGDHGSVKGIRSALTLTGLGHSSLLVDDASATAQDRVTVNATRVGADAADRFFATGGSLAYSGMSSLTLNLSRANDDVALLTPSATTPFTVNGSLTAFQAGHGALLNLNLAGVTSPVNTRTTPGSGKWTFGNRQAVTYT